MGVWKNVGQQLGGLAKHVASTAAAEPVEIIEQAVGQQKMEQGQQVQQSSNDPVAAVDPMADLAKAGFRTEEDFQKYKGVSEVRDEKEKEMLRKQLVREWGLDTNVESGMQKASEEWKQKEKQRMEVKEKQEEQKKEFEFQKKQQEDLALTAAKSEASAETKAWGAG